jgi:hypothetical protein
MASDPRARPTGQEADVAPARDDLGGDLACWLSLVCPMCGRINEGPNEGCAFCEPPGP